METLRRHRVLTSRRKQQTHRRHSPSRANSCAKLDLGKVATVAVFLLCMSRTAACPSRCHCFRQNEVWCNNLGLTQIPRDLPPDTKQLYLFGNNIAKIGDGTLSRLPNLKNVDLSTNKIDNVGFNAAEFHKLKKLESLNLSGNRVTRITRGMFSGMTSLVRLYLNRNQIRMIDSSALRNMTSLLELQLSSNGLQTFPKIFQCPNLQRLYVDGNRLVRMQPGSLTDVNLEELKAANNSLSQLPKSVFRDLSNLRKLDIGWNRFTSVPSVVKNMTSLTQLKLAYNPITSLPLDLIANMKRLKEIYVNNMNLTTLSKSFIPKRVAFNVADFSSNPWRCTCDLLWLSERMAKHIFGEFINSDKTQCRYPQNMIGRVLESLSKKSLRCESSNDGNSANQPEPPTPKKPSIDLCDGLTCNNGGQCYINKTSNMPACRCPQGWKGLVCQIRILPSTTTTTHSTSSPTKSSIAPSLHFDKDSIKPTSVNMFLPRIGTSLTISISKLHGSKYSLFRDYKAEAERQPFTVTDLEPGSTYKICVIVTDLSTTGQKIEDQMCGEVSTPDIITTTKPTSKTVVVPLKPLKPSHNPESPPKHGQGETINGDPEHTVNEPAKAEFQLLYPALGAGLGAFVILVIIVMFYVCYRNKQKLKHKDSNDNGPSVPRQPEYTFGNAANDSEMKPMMASQKQMVYMGQQPPVTSTLLQSNGEMIQPQHPSIQSITVSPKRVGTPPKNGSLGRSSNSDGSVTQVLPYHYDRQRCYSTGSGNHQVAPQSMDEMRCVPSPSHSNYQTSNVPYTSHVPYTSSYAAPVPTNRNQEYVYRAQHHGAETYADGILQERVMPSTVMPQRGTTTTVNQYHQGPISATTVSPESTYRAINCPAPMTGYAPVMARQPMQYTPQRPMPAAYYGAAREGMGSEAYRPSITSAHHMAAFQDTLVM